MKKQLAELNELINKMAQNHFLLPSNYSDKIQMMSHDFSYRTYVAESSRNSKGRYINFELYNELDVKFIDVHFRGDRTVEVSKDVTVTFSLSKILEVIKAIYQEKHSFENHAEGIKPLKEKISNNLSRIKSIQKENEELRLQIEGLKQLNQTK
jgi:hypothetical protein